MSKATKKSLNDHSISNIGGGVVFQSSDTSPKMGQKWTNFVKNLSVKKIEDIYQKCVRRKSLVLSKATKKSLDDHFISNIGGRVGFQSQNGAHPTKSPF